ncbi:hypothetical protein TNCV_2275371 [Trichonephila clavipes]|nr:hypothetical protein TNCV_2275371 [Trichonephila clavipes]
MMTDITNNDRAHICSVKQFPADKRITVLEHLPYSQDLTLYDFYHFLKLENALKGTYFQSVDEVKAKTADLLKMVTHNELRHCSDRRKTHAQQCIDRRGEYVEKD